MRWPWSRKPEVRESLDRAIARLLEAEATGTIADTASTAAVEAAAGALSRALASAKVEGPRHVREAVTRAVLAQVGRDLIRAGESLHVIDVDARGRVLLIPSPQWTWEGGNSRPDSWMCRVTTYGPSSSTTSLLPAAGVVHLRWGSSPGQPYRGSGPLSWASTTARLSSATDMSLANESAGPLAQLLALPSDGGDGGDDDPLAMLKADIAKAKGKALAVETTAAGWGEGRGAAPAADWKATRLGPNPPAALAAIRKDAFEAVLAACGTPPALHTADADGTAQREAVRRWHLGTVLPLAGLIEDELSEKLEGDCRLRFDSYPKDMVSRAQVVSKLVSAGVPVNVALAAVGLDEG